MAAGRVIEESLKARLLRCSHSIWSRTIAASLRLGRRLDLECSALFRPWHESGQ